MTSQSSERPAMPTDEPRDGFIAIGDVVLWMASIGGHLSSEETAERMENAGRTIIGALGDGIVSAEGHEGDFIFAPIPTGTWAGAGGMEYVWEMNRPFFHVGPEGGVLRTRRREWRGITLKKADAFSLWSGNIRDEIVVFVRQGRLTPEEAQVWARDMQLETLPGPPDVDAFDPMHEPDWSLGMALAWIMCRDVDAVREMWETWRESQEIWLLDTWVVPGSSAQTGWRFRMKAEWSPLFDLTNLAANVSLTLIMPREDAERELWHMLRDGRFVATGLPLGGGIREEIPAIRWRDLHVYEERRRLVVKDAPLIGSGFRDVAISSKKTRRTWPARTKTSSGRIVHETKCKEWLTSLMSASPDFRPKPKAEFFVEAKKRFSGISEAAFDRAWANAVKSAKAEAWSHAGAPRKNLQGRNPRAK